MRTYKSKPSSPQEARERLEWVEYQLPKTKLQLATAVEQISENIALVQTLQQSLIVGVVTPEEFLVFIRGYCDRIAYWHKRRQVIVARLNSLRQCETQYYEELVWIGFEAYRQRQRLFN